MDELDRSASSQPLAIPVASEPRPTLEQMIAFWLDAKAQRSASQKTARAYEDTLASFRDQLVAGGMDLDAPYAAILATAAQGWAGLGDPAAATFNQRLAVVSSFYQFVIRRGWMAANPIAMVERRMVEAYRSAQPLNYSQLNKRLMAIDRATQAGARDYALLAIGLQTGRRISEVSGWRWGDVQLVEGKVTLTTRRTKGGHLMRDTLPLLLSKALIGWLHMFYGAQLGGLAADAPIWINLSRRGHGSALTNQSLARICELHLGTSKFHTLRHTFAHAMDDVHAKPTEIQARLGHKNVATTSLYLASMRKDENPHADALAALLGLDTL